ncbi:MAG: hypothetical protein HWD59_05285 [Coxiellaceae bacterium]|nr:MAG: hypothetical protein HWD59_05285 [Coxiellaceae bacterium]
MTHVIIGQIKELKIETLILDRITYADAGIIDALLDLIANNQIETLSLKFNQFSPLVIKKIIDKLQHHKTLRVLDLYGTRIDPISAQELLQQLTDNNLSIEKINLTLSQPDTMVMIALVEFNQRPVALWKLKLEELYQQLAELLQKLDRSIDKNDSVVFSWIIDQAQKTYRNYEAGIVGADLLQPMRLTLSILKNCSTVMG